MANKTFSITIEGIGVSPATVRLRDLYEVLHAFESAISSTANFQADLHLLDIEKGIAGCLIGIDPAAYPSAVRCANAIAAHDLSPLPEKARDGLAAIQSKAKNKTWTIRLSGQNGMPAAEIKPDTTFVADSTIKGVSSITAKLVRVGGTPRPTAQLALPNGQRLTASIASEQLATALSPKLYRTITVEGEAQWSSADWSLVSFHITAVGPYDDTASLADTLAQLRTISRGHWDEIDPDEYIASLREEAV